MEKPNKTRYFGTHGKAHVSSPCVTLYQTKECQKVPNLLLNDRIVEGFKKPGMYWDASIRAFGVRVGKNTKTFIMVKDGGRRISLGRYPATSLKEARRAALNHQSDAPDIAASQTLRDARQTYMTTYVEPNYKKRTIYVTRRLFALTDGIEDKQLSELTAADFTAILDNLRPSQANHLYGVLKTFFGWCERRDLVAASPIRKLTKPHKEKERKRTLTDAELKAIWNACLDDSFGKIVRMLILTGQRRGEIAALERGWINENTAAKRDGAENPFLGFSYSITFPPHITKNGEEHTIPLTRTTASILSLLHSAGPATPHKSSPSDRIPSPNSNLLFPSPKTGKVLIGFQKMKRKLDKRSGIKGWTLHDQRRTWSTKSAELGTPPHVIEKCLNHLTGSISPLARRYNQHQYLAEAKEAFERYEAYISRLISPQSSA